VEGDLKIFTELNKDEVASIMQTFLRDRASRMAQKTLAFEVTKIVHGIDMANAVQQASEVIFHDLSDFSSLDKEVQQILKAELQMLETTGNETLPNLLVGVGLATSNSEAMRLIKEGEITIKFQKITAESADFKVGDNLVKRGKNNLAIITRGQ